MLDVTPHEWLMEEYERVVKARLPWLTCADPDCDCDDYFPAVNTIRPVIELLPDGHDDGDNFCEFCGWIGKTFTYPAYPAYNTTGRLWFSGKPFLCGLPPV